MADPTELSYLENMYLYEDTARVVDTKKADDGTDIVILDKTIFYPQGGGQPSDIGVISDENSTFRVTAVKFTYGIVEHYGEYEDGSFSPDDTVELTVDETNRINNAKIHTAGHLIDTVVWDLGHIDLTPAKGYHFPDGPNVEYQGAIPEEEREDFKMKLEGELNKRIQNGYEVKRVSAQGDELDGLCTFVPDYLPKDKPIWVATVWGEKGLPCGGTHVKNISEIGHVTIRKVKCKKGNTKIGYELN